MNEEEEKEKKELKQLEKTNFFSRLMPYNRPFVNVVVGFLGGIV